MTFLPNRATSPLSQSHLTHSPSQPKLNSGPVIHRPSITLANTRQRALKSSWYRSAGTPCPLLASAAPHSASQSSIVARLFRLPPPCSGGSPTVGPTTSPPLPSPRLLNAKMHQPNFNNKSTPGRRRHQSRHSSQPAATKSYASENDMPAELQFPLEFPNASGPLTPQKSASGSPGPSSLPANSKSKSRPGNKPRPKNVSISPGPIRHGRSTPPYAGASKSSNSAAFAGATFHASPAPSSVPIPSFLAKSMSDSPANKDTGRISQEPSPPATDSEAPTPLNRSSVSRTAREESPLDVFFRADRAEKERARRASSANALASAPGPFSPPSQTNSPPECSTFPKASSAQPPRRPGFQRDSPQGISATELDGTPGKPMGPAFSTPYQERIRAARSSEKQVLQTQKSAQTQHSPSDKSEALKKFLFAGKQTAAPAAAAPPMQQTRAAMPAVGQFPAAASPPVQPAAAGPATNGPVPNRSPDLLLMEDSLRRILKLDSGASLGSARPLANSQSS